MTEDNELKCPLCGGQLEYVSIDDFETIEYNMGEVESYFCADCMNHVTFYSSDDTLENFDAEDRDLRA